jgi:hypothetical protein
MKWHIESLVLEVTRRDLVQGHGNAFEGSKGLAYVWLQQIAQWTINKGPSQCGTNTRQRSMYRITMGTHENCLQ